MTKMVFGPPEHSVRSGRPLPVLRQLILSDGTVVKVDGYPSVVVQLDAARNSEDDCRNFAQQAYPLGVE